MKKIFTIITLICINFVAKSQDTSTYVDVTVAKNIGLNFFHQILKTPKSLEVKDLELIKKISGTTLNYSNEVIDDEKETFFYIFSTLPNKGFIIISANKNFIPVIGYSTENEFNIRNKNENFFNFIESTKQKIKLISEKKIELDIKVKNMWDNLTINKSIDASNKISYSSGNITSSTSLQKFVPPLIKSKWGQSNTSNQYGLYNLYTPPGNDLIKSRNAENTLTGCVATAVAQVMKYWKYPTNGFNSKSYYDNNSDNGWAGGPISANFGATKYLWDKMPDIINSTTTIQEINEVAKIMSHSGISVNMNYGYTVSLAYANEAKTALVKYFNYDSSSIKQLSKSNFANNLQIWTDTLKNELSNARPVIYTGAQKDGYGGHCFILDGYRDVLINNNQLTYL